MRQAARQLSERREPLEPVQLLLALARMPQLPDHVVEAARQQADFVAPMRLRHRLEAARARYSAPRSRPRESASRNDRPGCTRTPARSRKSQTRSAARASGSSSSGCAKSPKFADHLHVAEQMVFDLDRNQVDRRLRRETELAGRNVTRLSGCLSCSGVSHSACLGRSAAPIRFGFELFRIRFSLDAIETSSPCVCRSSDVVVQLLAIDVAAPRSTPARRFE